jgi:hypothetical protein
VTKTVRHKTAAIDPVKLYWERSVKEMVDVYLESLRPIFANDRSKNSCGASLFHQQRGKRTE